MSEHDNSLQSELPELVPNTPHRGRGKSGCFGAFTAPRVCGGGEKGQAAELTSSWLSWRCRGDQFQDFVELVLVFAPCNP